MAALERIRQISFKQVVLWIGGLVSAIGAVLWWRRQQPTERIETIDAALTQLSRAVEDYVGEEGVAQQLSRMLFTREENPVGKAKELLARPDIKAIMARQGEKRPRADENARRLTEIHRLLERALKRNADPICRVFIEAGVDVSAVGQLPGNRDLPFIVLFERANKSDLVDKSLQQIMKNHEDSQKVPQDEVNLNPSIREKAIRQIKRILEHREQDSNTTFKVIKKMTSSVLRVVSYMTLLEWAMVYQLPVLEQYVWSGKRDMSGLSDDHKEDRETLTLVMQEIAQTEVGAAWKWDENVNEKQKPLLWAARIGQIGLLDRLLRDARHAITEKDTFGYTALHHAVANHRVAAVRRLLQDPRINYIFDAKTAAGQTALRIAESNDQDIAALLQERRPASRRN